MHILTHDRVLLGLLLLCCSVPIFVFLTSTWDLYFHPIQLVRLSFLHSAAGTGASPSAIHDFFRIGRFDRLASLFARSYSCGFCDFNNVVLLMSALLYFI